MNIYTHYQASQIKEIAGAIHGLVAMVEDDGARCASCEQQPVIGPFELGATHLAIKHLANRADELAGVIEEEGLRFNARRGNKEVQL